MGALSSQDNNGLPKYEAERQKGRTRRQSPQISQQQTRYPRPDRHAACRLVPTKSASGMAYSNTMRLRTDASFGRSRAAK